jgi:hypothetical protein
LNATPDLEQRIAALEECLAVPDVILPFDGELTADDVARLREGLEKAVREPLQPRRLLTPETARELLRECVTVVKPGEVLAVRLPMNMNSQDMERAHDYGKAIERETGVKVAFIPGEEFAAVTGTGVTA